MRPVAFIVTNSFVSRKKRSQIFTKGSVKFLVVIKLLVLVGEYRAPFCKFFVVKK